MVEQAARWVFGVSWQAGVLIGVVMGVRWLLGRSLTPGWRCALWVVVGVRLVVPGVVGVFGERVADVGRSAVTGRTGGVTVTVAKYWGPEGAGGEGQGLEPRGADWGWVLGWVWGAGVVVVLGRLVVSNARLGWRVRGMGRVTEEGVLALVRRCAGEMGVKRQVMVVETREVRSPAVWGLWRPVVMLPGGWVGRDGPQAGRLHGEELRMVLLHEMAHVRRGDVWVEGVAGVLRAVHWFNPLVWVAGAMCRADREMACDGAVLRRVGAGCGQAYGACLLRVVEAVGGMRAEPAAVGVFGSKGAIRRRIGMIAAYRGGRRSAAASVLGGVVLAGVACAAVAGAKEPGAEGVGPPPVVAEEEAAGTGREATLAAPEGRVAELRHQAGADGVAKVAARREVPGATVTRVYDVRDLLMEIPDFDGSLTDIGPARAPATRPAMRTRKELVAELVKLIEETVAPSSWRDHGGAEGSVRELSGQLIVTQTAERQRAIQGLLKQLHEARGIQITVEAYYLVVDPKVLIQMGVVRPAEASAAKGSGGGLEMTGRTFTDEMVAALLKGARESSGAALLTAPRVTMLNGQRSRVTVGEPVEYVADYTVVKGKDGGRRFEPVKRTVTSGIVTEIQSTATRDRKGVTLAVDTRMTKVIQMAESTFSAPGGHEKLPLWEPVTEQTAVRMTRSVPSGGTLAVVGGAVTGEGVGSGEGRAGWVRLILFRPALVLRETAGRQG